MGSNKRITSMDIDQATSSVILQNTDRLYSYQTSFGWQTIGYDYCYKKCNAVATWLGKPEWLIREDEIGTVPALERYLTVMMLGSIDGRTCEADLTPQLIGLEGRRVEVVDKWGDTRRFKVGKSTGWMPCHLELANSRSRGGGSVYGAPFRSVRVIK